jgi:signal-transduction protein with cAMP-binding, CBS, and nucleotidyltransferase domain
VREQLRAFLCHGVAKVALERSGTWIAIFNLTNLRSQKCDRTQLLVTQMEANEMLQEIKQSGNKLGTTLGNLRRQFAG